MDIWALKKMMMNPFIQLLFNWLFIEHKMVVLIMDIESIGMLSRLTNSIFKEKSEFVGLHLLFICQIMLIN